MEITKTFSISDQRNRRVNQVVWMRRKNIQQSFVFRKSEVDAEVRNLKSKGWVEIPQPKSIFG